MGVSSISKADKQDAESATFSTTNGLAESNDTVDEAKLMHKIDMRILPYICILYLLAFLDRVNMGNAVLFSLQSDLKLSGRQYETSLMIFFISFTLFEIPSNIILRRLKPHLWLSLCMFGFGVVTVIQGFTQNFGGILATRFFLGLFEAGMFPGCLYLLSMWYRREESQKRFTFFFSSTSVAGAFGGLLAAAIGKMDGLRGYYGWRWIFIIEGLLTTLVAIAWYFCLPDFPEDATFLTLAERDFVIHRLKDDVGVSDHRSSPSMRSIAGVFKDYRIYFGGFMYFGLILPAYGYSYFSPTIIKSFGYGVIETQLRSVPPYAASFGFGMLVAYTSDRIRHRYLFAIVSSLVGLSGYATLLAFPSSIHVRYGALFLAACGTYSAMPVVLCWFGSNFAGHVRRSTGIAYQLTAGNLGGIIAVYIFPSTDAPRYHKGYALCVAFLCMSMTASTGYFTSIMVENNRRDKILAEKGGYENEKKEVGDLNPSHRYLL